MRSVRKGRRRLVCALIASAVFVYVNKHPELRQHAVALIEALCGF